MIKYPLQYESKRSYFDGEISEYFVVKDNDGQLIFSTSLVDSDRLKELLYTINRLYKESN